MISSSSAGVHCVNSSQIVNSLANLCATFNCQTISTISRKENEEELERCVTRISEDTIICVEKKAEYESYRTSVEKELKNLISHLFTSKDTNQRRIFPDKNFDMNGYEQNLKLLKESEQKNQNFASILLLDYTLIIFRHLCALRTLTPDMVLSDLKEHFELVYKSREHPLQIDTLIYERSQNVFKKKLTEIEESGRVVTDPKLEKLVELLKTHAESPGSRGRDGLFSFSSLDRSRIGCSSDLGGTNVLREENLRVLATTFRFESSCQSCAPPAAHFVHIRIEYDQTLLVRWSKLDQLERTRSEPNVGRFSNWSALSYLPEIDHSNPFRRLQRDDLHRCRASRPEHSPMFACTSIRCTLSVVGRPLGNAFSCSSCPTASEPFKPACVLEQWVVNTALLRRKVTTG